MIPPMSRLRKWMGVGLLSLASWLGWEGYHVILGSNFHVVVPEKIYRGAQRSPEQLEDLIKKHGIRTVINLRSLCSSLDWYLDQCRTVQRLGINQEDLALSANELPPAQELRRLVEILDHAEYPIYFHCRRGADRTGLACVVAKILTTDASWDEARGQLNWRFGHVAFGRPAHLDRFFELYTDWLARTSRTHTKDTFRNWVLHEYKGGYCSHEVEECRRLPAREGTTLEQPVAYRVKFRNTGMRDWNITTHARSGVHVGYRVQDEQGETVLEGKSCLRNATVPPGESYCETLVLPKTLARGRYRVVVDLCDEYQGWFYQVGSQPINEELEIRE